MIAKKKICAGFNNIEHEDYIYKNINGKKYCKSCTFKLKPPKSIIKVSKKQKLKITVTDKVTKKDHEFYKDVWYKTFGLIEFYDSGSCMTTESPRCAVCRDYLGSDYTSLNFHHILEKSKYPEYRHVFENISILCPNCHSQYEIFPDKVPFLVDLKKQLIEKYNL